MAVNTKQVLKNALALSPKERATLVDDILSSLDQPDEEIDTLWRKEVDDRIAAFKSGKIKAVPLEDVFSKYRK